MFAKLVISLIDKYNHFQHEFSRIKQKLDSLFSKLLCAVINLLASLNIFKYFSCINLFFKTSFLKHLISPSLNFFIYIIFYGRIFFFYLRSLYNDVLCNLLRQLQPNEIQTSVHEKFGNSSGFRPRAKNLQVFLITM